MPKVLSVSLTLSTGAALLAQLPPGSHVAAPGEHMIEWPAALGTGTPRKVIGIFWDNVDLPSAIGVSGTTGGRAVAPAVMPSIVPFDVGAPIIDLVRLPRAGLVGTQNRDALLLTTLGATELVFARTDAGGAMVVTLIAHPGWQRASALTALGDATGIDVVGRSLAGTTVLRTRYDLTLGTFTQLPDLAITEPIRDLCLVDWDGNDVKDVAVLTDTKLRVYDPAGGVLRTIPLDYAGGAVELVPDAVERDQLALLRRNTPTSWELLHVNSSTLEPAVAVAFEGSDFALVDMTSGDLDGDGDADLAIQDDGNTALLVRSRASAPHFPDPAAIDPFPVGNLGGVQAPADLHDYDYDGVADLLVPLAAGNGKGYLVLVKGLAPQLDSEAEVFDDIFRHSTYDADQGHHVFRLNLEVGDDLIAYPDITVRYYTRLEEQQTPKQPVGAPFTYTNSTGTGWLELVAAIPVEAIDYPHLLFFSVQFENHASTTPTQKPIFLAGGTVDFELGPDQDPPVSTYLQQNKAGEDPPREIRRINPGRILIGLFMPQKFHPL